MAQLYIVAKKAVTIRNNRAAHKCHTSVTCTKTATQYKSYGSVFNVEILIAISIEFMCDNTNKGNVTSLLDLLSVTFSRTHR